MIKQKVINILKLLLVHTPFFINGGLELIIVQDRNIISNGGWITTKMKKPKNKINKQKFADMMKRLT